MVKKKETMNRGMAASRLLVVMSVFLVLAVVGHQMIKRSIKKEAESETRSVRTTGKQIDAEPYRELLEEVEELLYQEHAPTYKDTEAIQKAVRDLTLELQKNTGRQMKNKAIRFMYFGENIGTEGGIGYGPMTPSARRRWIGEWETIVKEIFLPVDWLQGMQQREKMDSDSTKTALTDLLDELENMVSNIEPDMEQFGSTYVNMQNISQGNGQERLEQWRDWVNDWIYQVDQAASNLPDGFSIPNNLKAAYENTEFAIRRMKEVPNPGAGVFLGAGDERLNAVYLPDTHSRQTWLKDIDRIIKQARSYIEKLGQ